ncbi:GNAT family N-acetyltransferase [Aquimarina sp. 2304DJ70-9]|uniref:GNAT family N-acetyltransferase n=1 Tax=Aquimarina penaris TaxID=3231044 RepID=UPI0034631011
MKKIDYTCTSTIDELEQIIQLQHHNLPSSISITEKQKEGFVTVQHDLDILKRMNDLQPHIIAKDDDNVVGYALSMVKDFKNDIEVLKPMFDKIDRQIGDKISYVVMGQICIDKAYRKQGIFKGLYHKMRDELKSKYNLLITEVAANNNRSLQAHYTVGFTDLLVYDAKGITWHIVQWDWK